MNSQSRRSTCAFALLCAAGLPLTGCASDAPSSRATASTATAVAAANGASFTFFFWPDANVYLDVDRDIYYWIEDGRPKSGDQLPDQIMQSPGTAVVVRRSSANPFDDRDVQSLARRGAGR